MNDFVTITKTTAKGSGVFAAKNIKKGQLVVHGRGLYRVKDRTVHSFQLGKDKFMQLDKLARSINHSCEPNLGVRNNDCNGYDFIALRDIKAGEELTWDYETTEYEVLWFKECTCGSKRCRHQIRGFKFLDRKTRESFGEFMADYLKSAAAQA
ncbi:MAG TPA: SET domain-containing methyltransferase [Candidatus Saccharimonadales bacterium]|nr:SET domain-containing methyltransferase [Candidatus Saccharimonadales bacterium]